MFGNQVKRILRRSGTFVLLAGLILGGLPAPTAEARHEQELAEGLARDFQFFELAKELLREQLQRTDLTEDAKAKLALSLNQILLAEAAKKLREGNRDEADRLKKEAEDVINQYGGEGGVTVYAGKMQMASSLIEEMDQATDDQVKADKRREAIKIYEECRDGYKGVVDKLYPQYSNGDFDADSDKANTMRLCWYYYGQCLYELAKLGVDKVKNIESLSSSIDELMFEFEGTFVSFYSALLLGDAYVLDEQWGKASTQYEMVISLPVHPPGIDGNSLQSLTELRMTAYHKSATSYLKQGDLRRVVNVVNKLFADYPDKGSLRQMKLCRLLKSEALIKLRLQGEGDVTVEGIIAELQPFANDPDKFFRFKYLEVLANVGRYPNLDLNLRLRCGRAAFDSGKFAEAAQIYQLIISSLRVVNNGRLDAMGSQRNFERYAPEAYWRLGESLANQWRFFEAAMVFYMAAQKFTYFAQDPRFADGNDLPNYMVLDGQPMFDKFENMEKVRGFPLELAQRAKTCITSWSPAGRNPNDPQSPMRGSVEAKWTEEITVFERRIKNKVGTDRAELQRDLFSRAWKQYNDQRPRGESADFLPALSMFMMVEPVVGPDLYFEAFSVCAEMMKAEYDKRMNMQSPPSGDPFPENNQDVDNPLRGEDLYRWERERIGKEIFNKLPDNHQERLRALLDKILDRRVQSDFKLLYWYKARYFYLRLFYMITSRASSDLVTADPQVWSRPVGDVLGVWCSVINQELDGMEPEAAKPIRRRMRDLAYAIYYYGNLLRANPWMPDRSNMSPLKEESNAKEMDNEHKQMCLNVWKNFQSNFVGGFTDKNATEHESQQRKLRSLVKGVLYYAFIMQIGLRQPQAAEAVLQQFDLAFPPQVRQANDDLKELDDWRKDFIERLAKTYDLVNFDEKHALNNAATGLSPIIGRLKSEKAITLDEIKRTVEQKAIFCWVERAAGNIVCPTEESLLNAYLAHHLAVTEGVSFIGNNGSLDPKAMQQYIADHPNTVAGLFTTVEEMRAYRDQDPDKFYEYLKLAPNDVVHLDKQDLLAMFEPGSGMSFEIAMKDTDAFILDAVKLIREMGNNGDFEGIVDFAERYRITWTADEAQALYNAVRGGMPNPVPGPLVDLYNGHKIRAFIDRYRIATALETVQGRYLQNLIKLDRSALIYWAQFYTIDQERLKAENSPGYDDGTRYGIGKRFFQAEMWDQALEYLEGILDARNDFKAESRHPYGLSTGTDRSLVWQRDEFMLRYYVGRCYAEKGAIIGTYDPERLEWKKAETNMIRLYEYIQFRNRERQLGNNAPVNYERLLDQYYYIILYRLSRMFEAKAEYFTAKGDLKVAYDAWFEALNIHGLIGLQSPSFSPDEREAKYEFCRICYKIAQLGNEPQYNKHLDDALAVFNSIYRGANPDDFELYGDPVYDSKMDRLFGDCKRLKDERR